MNALAQLIGGARQLVGWRVAAFVSAGALVSAACGNTEGTPDSQATAGRTNAGSAAAATAGQPQASGTGGRASAGTGQAGGAGGGGLAGTGSGGDTPARHPLLVGDAACPPAAPEGPACSVEGTCVYRGISSGLAETNDPMRCTCTGGAWACVRSDEQGETTCPDGTVASELPRHGESCPVLGQSCLYALLAQHALAGCYCRVGADTGAAGGSAGAGPEPSTWFCGV